MRVAVIGLGTMGAPMARHLLAAGHEVTVHNRTRSREEPLEALGAKRAATPAAAAAGAEAVLTCVSDTPDLEHIVLRGRHLRLYPTHRFARLHDALLDWEADLLDKVAPHRVAYDDTHDD